MQKDSDFVVQDGVLLSYRGTSRSVVVPSTVTRIGYRAFCGVKWLSSLTIPNSVTDIAERAFESCQPLRSITLPDSITRIGKWAFSDCKRLESIELPPGLTEIAEGTFDRCTHLVSVKLPEALRSIGSVAFCRCTRLREITLPWTVRQIKSRAFELCESLDSVKALGPSLEIGDFTFYACLGLRTFSFGGSLNVGNYAFTLCPLDHSAIPIRLSLDSDRKMNAAFSWLSGAFTASSAEEESVLSSYVNKNRKRLLGRAIKEKNTDAFVKLSEVVTSAFSIDDLDAAIAESAGETALTAAILQYKNSRYSAAKLERHEELQTEKAFGLRPPSAAEQRKIFSVASLEDGYAILAYKGTDRDVVIPDKIGRKPVVEIARNAFFGNAELHSVTMPAGIKRIGDYAFSGCTGLCDLKLPPLLTSIGKGAFSGCTGISVLTIPDAVSSVGAWCFHKCSRLSSLVIRSESLRIGAMVFAACDNLAFVAVYTGGVTLEPLALPPSVEEIVAPVASPAESYAARNRIRFTAIG